MTNNSENAVKQAEAAAANQRLHLPEEVGDVVTFDVPQLEETDARRVDDDAAGRDHVQLT